MADYPVNDEAAPQEPWTQEILKIRTNENLDLANQAVKALAEELSVSGVLGAAL